jgi:hypothetical protein
MLQALSHLDRILRGELTRPEELRAGSLTRPLGALPIVLLALGMVYGACLGVFAITHHGSAGIAQFIAAILKIPLLFILTLVVTFPSLYVFTTLVGSRLQFGALLRLMISAMAIMLTVLASLGPIVAFFILTTSTYPFVVLLNVIICAVAGLLGLIFLMRTLFRLVEIEVDALFERVKQENKERTALHDIAEKIRIPPGELSGATPEEIAARAKPAPIRLEPQEMDPMSSGTVGVFYIWMFVFMLVGCEMAWVLRPFIGAPGSPAELFRTRGGGFFEAVLHCFSTLGVL